MPIRFQADADLNQVIVSAIVRRVPAVDFKTATSAGLAGLKDQEVCGKDGGGASSPAGPLPPSTPDNLSAETPSRTELDRDETLCREQVVLPALVDNPQIAVALSVSIGHD